VLQLSQTSIVDAWYAFLHVLPAQIVPVQSPVRDQGAGFVLSDGFDFHQLLACCVIEVDALGGGDIAV